MDRFSVIAALLLGLASCGPDPAPASKVAEILEILGTGVPGSHGMYIDAERIWLADTYRHVDDHGPVIDQNGRSLSLPPMRGVAGIAKHPDRERFMFADPFASKVHWVDFQTRQFGEHPIPQPWNARWDPTGTATFVVSVGGSVFRIANNEWEDVDDNEIVAHADAPFDVAPLSPDSFWLSEQGLEGDGRVCLFTNGPAGFEPEVCTAENAGLKNPEGLWSGPDGGVLAVDTEGGTLLNISRDGDVSTLVDGLDIPILVQMTDENHWVIYANRQIGPALIFGRL